MTQVVYRGNLAAASFPFVSQLQGRTIIVPQYDNVYVPQIASKTDEDKDRGIPQIYYCHNVLPTAQGLQAIGYQGAAIPFPLFGATTDNLYVIRSGTMKVYFARDPITGKCFIYKNYVIGWEEILLFNGGTALLTVAYAEGETYIYFQGIGCYRYDFGLFTLVAVVLTGVDIPTTIGILSTAGYLIAWTTLGVIWSSTIDPTDFTPSLITGAGGGSVQGAQGKLNVCSSSPLGFVVYTDSNAVAAVYSGNARYPFNFREIGNSGGCNSLDLITWEANSTVQYAYTSSGLQTITMTGATTVLPEATDFVAGKCFEDFNEVTKLFETTILTTAVMKKKLSLVCDRYLVLSYGLTEFTHAIVYDLVMRRWGKLKITHVKIFDSIFLPPNLNVETPKQSFAVLAADGTIFTVDFSINNPNSSGVLILGKYQYIRQRTLQIQQADIENINGAGFTLYNLPALDGKNYTVEPGYLMKTTGQYRQYNFNKVGLNHSLLWIGAFHAVSYVLYFNVHGKSSSVNNT